MERFYSTRALYMLLLMVSFNFFGGGNFAQAQESVTVASFTGSSVGTTELPDDWYRNSTATWSSSYYKVLKDAAIYSPQVDWSAYTEITVTVTARTFGGVAVANNKISVKIGTTEIGTVTPTSSTLNNYSFTVTDPVGVGRLSFSCDGATTSKGSGISAITITGKEGTQKQDPELAFPQASYSAEKSEEFVKPELVNKFNVKVSYSSSNLDVATVNVETGDVVLVGKGSTIISATSESDDTYGVGMASYVLTVTDKYAPVIAYRKIISDAELADGGIYLLVGHTESGETYVMSEQNSNNRKAVFVTAEDGKIILDGDKINTAATPYEVTLVKNEDGRFNLKVKGADSDMYLQNARTKTSGANYLRESASQTEAAVLWNWAVDNETGSVKFSNTVNNIASAIFYNESSKLFSCYGANNGNTSTSRPVYLYRKCVEVAANAKVDNYTTFCMKDYAYEMPAGVTGYAVTADGAGHLTKTEAYASGETVPAGTPLLLKATAEGTYYPVVLDKAVEAYAGENHLEAGRDAEGYTQSSREGVCYYKLAVNAEGEAGFYWGAADGAAFKMMKTTTAYLAVDKAQGVRGFVLGSGEATGIGEVTAGMQGEEAIYTLAGIRVRAAKSELPAGVYVANGKKFMVK